MNDANLRHTNPQSVRVTRAWIYLLKRMNLTVLKKDLFAISYTLFFLGFFFFPSSKSQANFFYVAVALPFLILIFMKKVAVRSFFSSRTFLLSTIFLVYMFSTLFWADNYGLSDISKHGRRVLYVLIFLGATIHLIQVYANFLQRLLVLLCWTAAMFAVGYIVFYYIQHPFPRRRLFGFGQLYNPIMASSIYGIVFIACLYLLQQQRTMKMKLLYLGMLAVLFLYMLLARSRGPLFALGVTIFGWTISESLLRKGEKYNYRNKLLYIALLLIFAVGVSLFMAYPTFFESRFIGRTTHRFEVWGKALLHAKDAPYFGHGLNADTRILLSCGKKRPHYHSVYMTTLFYGGIAGLLLLTALVGSAIWQGLTQTGELQKFLLTCMLVFGALCIVTDGNTLIRHPKPVWVFFWFPIALIAASELPGNLLRDEKRATMEIGDEVSAP